jgi:hypothetical protein
MEETRRQHIERLSDKEIREAVKLLSKKPDDQLTRQPTRPYWEELTTKFFNMFFLSCGTKFDVVDEQKNKYVYKITSWDRFNVVWTDDGVPSVRVPQLGAETTMLPIISLMVNEEYITNELVLVHGKFPYIAMDGCLLSLMSDEMKFPEIPALLSMKHVIGVVEARVLETGNKFDRP